MTEVTDSNLVPQCLTYLKLNDGVDDHVKYIKLEVLAILANTLAMEDTTAIIYELYRESNEFVY